MDGDNEFKSAGFPELSTGGQVTLQLPVQELFVEVSPL
jgi:hypothetical protein